MANPYSSLKYKRANSKHVTSCEDKQPILLSDPELKYFLLFDLAFMKSCICMGNTYST